MSPLKGVRCNGWHMRKQSRSMHVEHGECHRVYILHSLYTALLDTSLDSGFGHLGSSTLIRGTHTFSLLMYCGPAQVGCQLL